MIRGASLAFGVAVTWTIAVFGALFASYAFAFPLALFRGGDVQGSRAFAFGIGMLGCSIWAARTTLHLVREDRADRATFHTPWPREARGAELEALGVLDRRGQPGPAAIDAGQHDVDLRSGQRAERTIVLAGGARMHLAVTGPSDARVRIVDVELEERAELAVGRRGGAGFALEAGTYRLMTERIDSDDLRPARVQAWWIATSR